MKFKHGLFMGILSIILGCSNNPPVEGGLYYTNDEVGKYKILKVLKTDKKGVHVRLYSNVLNSPPKKIDENTLYMAGIDRKPQEDLGIGHVPLAKENFTKWKPVFFQQSTVKDEELDGYKIWLEGGGYF